MQHEKYISFRTLSEKRGWKSWGEFIDLPETRVIYHWENKFHLERTFDFGGVEVVVTAYEDGVLISSDGFSLYVEQLFKNYYFFKISREELSICERLGLVFDYHELIKDPTSTLFSYKAKINSLINLDFTDVPECISQFFLKTRERGFLI